MIGLIETEVQLKKWGSSVGVLLSKKDLQKEGLKEGQKVKIIVVKKSNPLRETFGTIKFSKSTAQLLKEVDKALWND